MSSNWFEKFRKFATRGNVLDLAIGFTVGAAFSTIAKSLVDDVIMPLVALVTGRINFEDRFFVLRTPEGATLAYGATLDQALDVGAITLNYGVFINNIITFLIVALAMFLIVNFISRLDDVLEEELGLGADEAPKSPADKKCPFCIQTIPRKATRCPHCTSELEPRVNVQANALA